MKMNNFINENEPLYNERNVIATFLKLLIFIYTFSARCYLTDTDKNYQWKIKLHIFQDTSYDFIISYVILDNSMWTFSNTI